MLNAKYHHKDKNLLSHIKIGRKILASHTIEIEKKISLP